jgi:hypothetical protein
MAEMLLFYSDHCTNCKMLLETIKRYNASSRIKCVSIDMLRGVGKNIPQIHSVPALVTLPDKKILFGKAVFDYLLLPKTGKLVTGPPLTSNSGEQNSAAGTAPQDPTEPMSFSVGSSGFSDSFAMIEDDATISENGLHDRVYGWSSLNPDDMNKLQPELADISVETRTKKEPIDLNDLYSRRAMDLEQSDLNTNQLPPPNTTR